MVSPALRLGAAGFGLIAVCYGFARFAFGLFLPQVETDLALGATLVGVISGGSFLGYCVAIVASAALTERIGARPVAVAAALVAALGMVGIAAAPNALWLAGAVLLAGSSSGLASPPLAAAVAVAVRPDDQGRANTVINAGTSAGVALSGPVALALGEQWRLAFLGFAAVALMLAAAAAVAVPAARADPKAAQRFPPLTGTLGRLAAAAFLAGAASTALWSFGGVLATLRLGWGSTEIGMLWTAVGAAGVAGAWAGSLVARFGIDRVHRTFLAAMAAGILAVGTAAATPATALLGGVVFGAAYVMLSGIYLVWGVVALPDRPATGLMVGFLSLAVGQTAGAPVFGFLMDRLGPDHAVVAFAIVSVAAGLASAGRTAGPAPGRQDCAGGERGLRHP